MRELKKNEENKIIKRFASLFFLKYDKNIYKIPNKILLYFWENNKFVENTKKDYKCGKKNKRRDYILFFAIKKMYCFLAVSTYMYLEKI